MSPPESATGRAALGPCQTKGRRVMPRVKRGAKRREKRKKLLARAKGYFLGKSKLYKFAKEATERAGNFAYTGRKRKKRDFRRLWIIRINAAARAHETSYSQLMAGLKAAGILLDRKSLAEIAAKDDAAFGTLVAAANSARPAKAAKAATASA
jgi:large subunit ribosomal protein L20